MVCGPRSVESLSICESGSRSRRRQRPGSWSATSATRPKLPLGSTLYGSGCLMATPSDRIEPLFDSDEVDPVVLFAMRVLARLEMSRGNSGTYLDAIEHAQQVVTIALGESAADG